MTWFEFILALVVEVFRFIPRMTKRQWAQRKQPSKILSPQNALAELKATRDHLNNVISRLEKQK